MNHNLTTTYWGHNIEQMHRNEDGSWKIAVWVNLRLSDGDTITVRAGWKGEPAILKYKIKDVEWQSNVGDMYFAVMYDPEVVG